MPSTPLRNVRVPDDVWLPAKARAREERTSVTAVVVEALRVYGRSWASVDPRGGAVAVDPALAKLYRMDVPERTVPQPTVEELAAELERMHALEAQYADEPARPACKHPAALVVDNICGACGEEVELWGSRGASPVQGRPAGTSGFGVRGLRRWRADLPGSLP